MIGQVETCGWPFFFFDENTNQPLSICLLSRKGGFQNSQYCV